MERVEAAVEPPDTIRALVERVHRRPMMYVGSRGAFGLMQMAQMVLAAPAENAFAGYATHLEVTVDADGGSVIVCDDGRGISLRPEPETGAPALAITSTDPDGVVGIAERSQPRYTVTRCPGLCGAAPLAEALEIRTWHDGSRWEQSFARGFARGPLRRTGATRRTGTEVTCRPDRAVLGEDACLDEEALAEQVRDLAFAAPGLTTRFRSRRTGRDERHHYPGGMGDLVALLTRGHTRRRPDPPFRCSGRVGEVYLDVALQHTLQEGHSILNLANGCRMPNGGSHVEALKGTLARVLGKSIAAEDRRKLKPPDLLAGLTAAVSVVLPAAEWEGPCDPWFRLASDEAGEAVATVLEPALRDLVQQDEPFWDGYSYSVSRAREQA